MLDSFNLLGGMGFNVFDGCLVAEEISYGCSGVMTALEGSGLGVSIIYFYKLYCVFIVAIRNTKKYTSVILFILKTPYSKDFK